VRRQIAVIFEFTGALVLGRVSQETISGGISDIGAFTTDPVRTRTHACEHGTRTCHFRFTHD
jgi:phosphate/sulfate permease